MGPVGSTRPTVACCDSISTEFTKPIAVLLKIFKNKSIGPIISSFSWLFSERLFAIGATLLTTILLVRHLGPEKFGIISFGYGVFVILAAISRLGLDNIVIREIVSKTALTSSILGSSFLLKLISSTVCLAALLLIYSIDGSLTDEELSTVIICSSLLFQPFGVIDLYFQSETKSKYVAISRGTAITVSALLKIGCIVFDLSLPAIALAYLLEHLLLHLLLHYFYLSNSQSYRSWKFSLAVSKSLLRSSWLLLLSGIAVTLYLKVDLIIIKYLLGNAAVGKYAAAAQLSEGWYFIPQIIVISIFPSIIKIRSQSTEQYYKRIQQVMYAMVAISCSVAILISFTAPFIINLLYGRNYSDAASVLTIHIWSGVFVFLGFVSGRWLIIEGMEFQAFKRSLIGAIANIALNFLLIPMFGIKGAAIATLLSLTTSMYFAFYFDKKTRKIFFMKTKAIFLFPRIIRLKI